MWWYVRNICEVSVAYSLSAALAYLFSYDTSTADYYIGQWN